MAEMAREACEHLGWDFEAKRSGPGGFMGLATEVETHLGFDTFRREGAGNSKRGTRQREGEPAKTTPNPRPSHRRRGEDGDNVDDDTALTESARRRLRLGDEDDWVMDGGAQPKRAALNLSRGSDDEDDEHSEVFDGRDSDVNNDLTDSDLQRESDAGGDDEYVEDESRVGNDEDGVMKDLDELVPPFHVKDLDELQEPRRNLDGTVRKTRTHVAYKEVGGGQRGSTRRPKTKARRLGPCSKTTARSPSMAPRPPLWRTRPSPSSRHCGVRISPSEVGRRGSQRIPNSLSVLLPRVPALLQV